MADPLSQVAQEFAPVGGANMFDPTVGRDVIARYGMAGARRDDADKNLRLSGLARNERLGAMREQEDVAAAPLRAALRDEEMDAILDKREARAVQGEFLSELWGLRRDDPDYRTKVEDTMAALPPALREDPAVETWWDYSENNLRDMDMRERAELQDSLIQGRADDRAVVSAVTAAGGNINPERLAELRQQYSNREDYIVAAVAEGSGKKRETTMSDRKEVIDYSHGKALERIRAYRDPRERAAAIEDFKKQADKKVKTTPKAFPPQIDAVRIGYAASELGDKATGTKEDIRTLMKRDGITSMKDFDERLDPLAVEDAKALDSDLALSEEQFALSYDSVEDYVSLVPGLNEREKEARRNKWVAAHEAWDAPAETEAAAPAAAGAPTGGKTLDQETALKFFKQAGGDRDKARQLARDAGYGF